MQKYVVPGIVCLVLLWINSVDSNSNSNFHSKLHSNIKQLNTHNIETSLYPFPTDCPLSPMNESFASRLAGIAIDGLTRQYPNIIHHVLNSDQDVLPPRQLTPSFYGCYDWYTYKNNL